MNPSDSQASGARRRGAALEGLLLEAAWDELIAVGYAKVTMEGVAARACTGKQVLYRRWPNRVQLMAAALRHRIGSLSTQVPDTGSLREDVLAVLRSMIGRIRVVPYDLMRGMLAELPDMAPEFFQVMPGVMMKIIRAAAARGELAHADVSPRIVSLPVDLLRYEGFKASSQSPSETLAEEVEPLVLEIVDDVFLPLIHAVAGHPAGGPRPTAHD